MTSQYARGTAFERAVRHSLEEDGYEVIRSAGSKGKVDLVAFKKGQILFIQCKLNGLCAPSERAEVLRLSSLVGALPIVAYKGTEGRQRPVRYRLLTGPGPKEFVGWISDKADEELERLARELDLPDAEVSPFHDSPEYLSKMFPVPRLGDPDLLSE